MNCPVCTRSDIEVLLEIDGKRYFNCTCCEARFLDRRDFLSSEAEYAHYLNHENAIDDPEYRKFLSKLAKPLIAKLSGHQHGLDYGCGPGPALARMLQEVGHRVELYDPYFFNNQGLLKQNFDFVVCSETAEHFHSPAKEFSRLNQMLNPGGWLALMTCFQTDDAAFANWHYRRDPTHVVFYRQSTFIWLANEYGLSCEFPAKDVAMMQKKQSN